MKAFATMLAAVAAISAGTAAGASPAPPPKTLDLAALNRSPRPIPPPPTPEKLALARQLMAALGFEEQMKAILVNFGSLTKQFVNPTAPPEQRRLMELVQQETQQALLDKLPDLEKTGAYIYATHLTEKELNDDIAWQTSESGRSIRAKTPGMTQDMTRIVISTIPRLTSNELEQSIGRVCQQNDCTPQQHQALNDALTKMTALQAAGQKAAASAAPFTGPRPTQFNQHLQWERQPDASVFTDYYPDRAQRMEKDGQAIVECVLTVEGLVRDCRVVEESPAGYGFGESTIRAAQLFRGKPMISDGKPVASLVDIPIAWKLGHTSLFLPLPPTPAGLRIAPPPPVKQP